MEPFDLILLRLRRIIPCEILCSLIDTILIIGDEQFCSLLLLRHILDDILSHDSDRICEIVIRIGSTGCDVFLSVDEGFHSIPFLFLTEIDHGDLSRKVDFLHHIPSEGFLHTMEDCLLGEYIEMIDGSLSIILGIVTPCECDQILILIETGIDLITLRFCENPELAVTGSIIIRIATEKHSRFRLSTRQSLALADL